MRVRILVAGLMLVAAGCMVLGWSSRSRHTAATQIPATQTSPTLAQAAIPPSPQASGPSSTQQAGSQAQSIFRGLPLSFEPNQGQGNLDPSDPRAKFVARGAGYSLFLGSEGAMIRLASHISANQAGSKSPTRIESLEMKLSGGNPNASVSGIDLLPGKSNYLLGHDPAKWRQDVPQFARIRYEDLYPGINLVFYGHQGQLEYDFQVAPGADPAQAELEFEGSKGMALSAGALVIKGEAGNVRLDAPRLYQRIAGRQQPVEGSFVLRAANRVGFAIGAYDHSRELVIDPVLTFSTYFGGSGDEHSTSMAVDGSGNIYLAGSTTSPNLPAVAGLVQTTLNGTQNVYVAKITPPQGSIAATLDYVTYLGGDGVDSPVGIGVDGAGDAFVAGTTSSTNFPTTLTAYQTAPQGGSTGTSHVFVTELNNAATSLLYSSYLSGNGTDVASGMTIDSKGYIYVTGTTTSSDVATTSDQFPASTLPQAQPFQGTPRAPIQFFVTKVNTAAPRTGSITYSTYFGGGNFNTTTPIAVGGGIAVDIIGNIYFTGTTNFTYTGCVGCQTTDFPILNAYQPCLDQAPPTVIINPATCTNTTTTANADAFVAKLNPTAAQGSQLLWSTYLGGTQTDSGIGIALDTGAANVYITGTTNSPDVTTITTFASYQRCLDTPINPAAGTACPTLTTPAPNDAFVARLSNPAASTIATNMSLTYFSYLGGSSNEAGLAIAVDSAAGALLTGWTQSADFPVFADSLQGSLKGPQDAFLARIDTTAVTGQNTTGSYANFFGGSATDQGTSITIDSNSAIFFAGDTNSTDLQLGLRLQPQNNGGYDAFVVRLTPTPSVSISGILSLGTNQTYISAGNQATFTYTVTNTGSDLATNIVFLNDLNPANTGALLTFNSATATSGTCSSSSSTVTTVSCNISSLQPGSTATVTVDVTPTATNSGNALSFNGGAVQVIGPNNIVLAQTSVSGKMSDFTPALSPSNLTLQAAGNTAVYSVTLTPHPVYGTNISLACTGLPAQSSCNFTTNPVTLNGTSPGTSTLNLTTTARPITTPAASLVIRHFYAIWLTVPGIALVGLGLGGTRHRRRLAGMLLLCALFTLLLLLPACSSTQTQAVVSGTPAGTYTITLTATASGDTKNQTFTLTVP